MILIKNTKVLSNTLVLMSNTKIEDLIGKIAERKITLYMYLCLKSDFCHLCSHYVSMHN